MQIKKPGSKKEQLIENQRKDHKKGQIRTANVDINEVNEKLDHKA